jgi:uncharacterized membrane protein
VTKVIIVLRLLVAISAFIKVDNRVQWDWSTTFWPYWCSFVIQAILCIASFISFAETVINYFKDEAIIEDSKIGLFSLIFFL